MASRGSSKTSPSGSKESSKWQCPVCLDLLETVKRPKLLPCAHTVCEKCLTGLTKHGASAVSFPCPVCRERVRVPRGGVWAFKNNIYLQQQAEESREKNTDTDTDSDLFCKKHAKPREIEKFCHDCRAFVCLECIVTEHTAHRTEDVTVTADSERWAMTQRQEELQRVVGELKGQEGEIRKEQRAVRDRKAAVERDISHRHKLMVDMADQCRDNALFALDTVTVSIDSELELVAERLRQTIDELDKLHKRMDMSVKSDRGYGFFLTAQGIYRDAERLQGVVQHHKARKITRVSRPVLTFSATSRSILRNQKMFLNSVGRLDIDLTLPEMSVKELFVCKPGKASLVEVFSLFPRADDTVWVAYEPSEELDGYRSRNPDLYDIRGKLVETHKSIKGRTNFTHTVSGEKMCVNQTPQLFSTFAKSRSPFKLTYNYKGQAYVSSDTAEIEQLVDSLTLGGGASGGGASAPTVIQCQSHRAFDVNSTRECFAVVEDFTRKVHVYCFLSDAPLATYEPPSPAFYPKDVCFYTLGGRELLLVADAASDVIHAVDMVDGRCQFVGYLAPRCAALVGPTALNTDDRGRLWVACKRGAVLLLQPL